MGAGLLVLYMVRYASSVGAQGTKVEIFSCITPSCIIFNAVVKCFLVYNNTFRNMITSLTEESCM